MLVLNVKSIKLPNGENKDNLPLQVSPKDTFFFKCGENDFECHDTFDSESEMTSN